MILYLQQFISEKFKKNPHITDQFKAIYYQMPAMGSFPYIYVGDFIGRDVSTRVIKKEEIYFKLVIYTRDKNFKFMLYLSEQIKKILNVTNEEKIILMKYFEEKLCLQNDGVTHQIILNLKAIVVEDYV